MSGQLNVEAYCLALSKVYTFGPTFRAENSNTSRHLAEFWMIEPEIAFANLADNATLAEALLKHIFRTVLAERADDMAFFQERIEKGVIAKLRSIVDSEFVRMDYTEAIRILEGAKRKFEYPVKWGIARARCARLLSYAPRRLTPTAAITSCYRHKLLFLLTNTIHGGENIAPIWRVARTIRIAALALALCSSRDECSHGRRGSSVGLGAG